MLYFLLSVVVFTFIAFVLYYKLKKDIIENKLESLLTNPGNLRIIGEKNLEFLLSDVLPKEYVLVQKDIIGIGTVDAAIDLGEKILPIDSKFPKYNKNKKDFERAIKDRIKETSKYVVPDKGTLDFALMYVHSETIYIKAFIENEDLLKFAWDNKVVPVSPNILYLYLATIFGFIKRNELSSKADGVYDNLQSSIKKFDDIKGFIDKSNKQIRDALNNIENGSSKLLDAVDLLKRTIGV